MIAVGWFDLRHRLIAWRVIKAGKLDAASGM
jgi:hypothetical protein